MQHFPNVYGQDRIEELLQNLAEYSSGEYDCFFNYTYEEHNKRFNDLNNELPHIQASLVNLEEHINYNNGEDGSGNNRYQNLNGDGQPTFLAHGGGNGGGDNRHFGDNWNGSSRMHTSSPVIANTYDKNSKFNSQKASKTTQSKPKKQIGRQKESTKI